MNGQQEHKAFPKIEPSYEERLRDEFAMAALSALISHPNKDGDKMGAKGVPILAKFAYEYADAALKAREIK